MQTPGHTDEDASLVVGDTQYGTTVFTHVWWFAVKDEEGNVALDEQGNPILFPQADPIGEDAEALEASRRKVICIADYIIPGHGDGFYNPFEDRDDYCDDNDDNDNDDDD